MFDVLNPNIISKQHVLFELSISKLFITLHGDYPVHEARDPNYLPRSINCHGYETTISPSLIIPSGGGTNGVMG